MVVVIMDIDLRLAYLFIVRLPVLVRDLLSRFVLGCFLFAVWCGGCVVCGLIVLVVFVVVSLDVVLC